MAIPAIDTLRKQVAQAEDDLKGWDTAHTDADRVVRDTRERLDSALVRLQLVTDARHHIEARLKALREELAVVEKLGE